LVNVFGWFWLTWLYTFQGILGKMMLLKRNSQFDVFIFFSLLFFYWNIHFEIIYDQFRFWELYFPVLIYSICYWFIQNHIMKREFMCLVVMNIDDMNRNDIDCSWIISWREERRDNIIDLDFCSFLIKNSECSIGFLLFFALLSWYSFKFYLYFMWW
jgi:hypothetical protein